jgi:CDP-glucose 4,6-dehydratase
MNMQFWSGKRVFVTGHTGFKGAWLSLWLQQMGAQVTGFALEPSTQPNLFEVACVGDGMQSIIGDIRDAHAIAQAITHAAPDVVIHMAAQPLVRLSYEQPVETYTTNVIGTVNLLEAIRQCSTVRAVVIVTTDKCYENKEWLWAYRENETLGGHDPYSNSKACAELITAAYRSSYFHPEKYAQHQVAIASARAGNVIGGGDWAADRLIPDIMRALVQGESVRIRNPYAIRPWQHVLEPLAGYLQLAEKLFIKGAAYSQAYNFGPAQSDAQPVQWIVERLSQLWGGNASWSLDKAEHPYEAQYLKLDCSKARAELGWLPRWQLEQALQAIVQWHQAHQAQQGQRNMRSYCLEQILQYSKNSSS